MLAIDSNVLAYAEGVDDEVRQERAISVINAIGENLVIPVQVLGELFNVLVRKGGHSKASAYERVGTWADTYGLIPTTASMLLDASAIAAAHDFQIWDAIILCAAAEAGCDLLLSEDMHEGFAWNGTTIANPFTQAGEKMLQAVLESGS